MTEDETVHQKSNKRRDKKGEKMSVLMRAGLTPAGAVSEEYDQRGGENLECIHLTQQRKAKASMGRSECFFREGQGIFRRTNRK